MIKKNAHTIYFPSLNYFVTFSKLLKPLKTTYYLPHVPRTLSFTIPLNPTWY